MKQKLLGGGETVANKTERLRDICKRGRASTLRGFARLAVSEGIYSEQDRDAAILRVAMQDVRRVLKEKDDAGLPRFGPVRDSDDGPVWVPRRLWKVEDYQSYYTTLKTKHNETGDQLSLVSKECLERYDHRLR